MGLPRLYPDSEPMLFLAEKLKGGEISLDVDAAVVKAKYPSKFGPYKSSTFKQALKRRKSRVQEELSSKCFLHRSTLSLPSSSKLTF